MINYNRIISTDAIRTAIAGLTTGLAWTPSVSSTTNLIQLAQGLAGGSRLTALSLVCNDTSIVANVPIVLQPGGTGNISLLGIITMTANVNIDALSIISMPSLERDITGKTFIHLAASDKIYIGVLTNMTSGKILFGSAVLLDYPTP